MIDTLLWVVIGILCFLILRNTMRGYFLRIIQRRVFEQEYSRILNSTEFKVKGRNE